MDPSLCIEILNNERYTNLVILATRIISIIASAPAENGSVEVSIQTDDATWNYATYGSAEEALQAVDALRAAIGWNKAA